MIDPYYFAYFSLAILMIVLVVYTWLRYSLKKDFEKFLSYNDVHGLREELVDHVRELNPTLILAVNTGGIALASYISKELPELKVRYFYCSVPLSIKSKKNSKCTIESIENSTIDIQDDDFNRILFIDDVCRTGNSMEYAIDCFQKHFKKKLKANLYITTLVSSKHASQEVIMQIEAIKANPNNYFTARETPHKDIRLPWHRPVNDPYIAKVKTEMLEQERKRQIIDLVRNFNKNKSNERKSDQTENTHQRQTI